MSDYTYLLASLPELFFDRAPAMDRTGFFRQCQGWVSDKVMEWLQWPVVSATRLRFPENAPAAFMDLVDFEHTLRLECARIRSRRLGRALELPGNLPGDRNAYAPELAKKAMEKDDPLEMARALLKLRWDFADQLKGASVFDQTALIVYAFKLEILAEMDRFDPGEGENALLAFLKSSAGEGAILEKS